MPLPGLLSEMWLCLVVAALTCGGIPEAADGETVEYAVSDDTYRLPENENIRLKKQFTRREVMETAGGSGIPSPLELHSYGIDPLAGQQWSHMRTGVAEAWEESCGKGVVIAVIDTGCDMDHPDLKENIWTNQLEEAGLPGVDDDGNGYVDDIRGWDFVSVGPEEVADGEDPGPPDNNPEDRHGHGTMVAGIAAAVRGNGLGIRGVAPEAELMILRAGYRSAEGDGLLRLNDVVEAVYYALNRGADIINMSFEGERTPLLEEAIQEALDSGVVVVGSAGGDGSFPAAMEGVISVSAVAGGDVIPPFAPVGGCVDCYAPGVSVWTTSPGGYLRVSGTSFAAPFVSGCSALLKCINPGWRSEMVAAQIINTTDSKGAGSRGYSKPDKAGICRMDRAVKAPPEKIIGVEGVQLFEMCGDGDSVVEGGEGFRLKLKIRNMWDFIGEAGITLKSENQGVVVCEPDGGVVGPLEVSDTAEIYFGCRLERHADTGSELPMRVDCLLDGVDFQTRFAIPLNGDIPLRLTVMETRELRGNGNGGPDPGETILVRAVIRNSGRDISGARVRPGGSQGGISIEDISLEKSSIPSGEYTGLGVKIHLSDYIEKGLTGFPLVVEWADYHVPVNVDIWVSFRGDRQDAIPPSLCQGGAGHMGLYREIPEPPLEYLWVTRLEGDVSMVGRVVAGGNGIFAAGDRGDSRVVYSIRDSNGAVRWKRILGGGVGKTPVACVWYRGICYVGGGSILYALTGETGHNIWVYGKIPEGQECRTGEPAVYHDRLIATVHCPGGGDRIVALDPYTGRLIWEKVLREGEYLPPWPPACGRESIYLGDGRGVVRALSERSGDIIWTAVTGGSPSAPLMLTDDLLISVSGEGGISALHPDDGSKAWEGEAGGAPVSFPVSNGEMIGVLYSTGEERLIRLIREEDGRTVWVGAAGVNEARGMISSGDEIYVTGRGGEVAVLDLKRGEGGKQSYCVEGLAGVDERALSGPAYAAGGRMYLAMNGNGVNWMGAVGRKQAPRNNHMLKVGNYPNPFNPSTVILLFLPESESVSADIFDAGGRHIRTLVRDRLQGGRVEIRWDGRNGRGAGVRPGVYFCRVRAGEKTATRKLLLVR